VRCPNDFRIFPRAMASTTPESNRLLWAASPPGYRREIRERGSAGWKCNRLQISIFRELSGTFGALKKRRRLRVLVYSARACHPRQTPQSGR
jgi:hypothetical protein